MSVCLILSLALAIGIAQFVKSPESWQYFGIPKSELKKVLVQSIQEDKNGLIVLTILNSSDNKISGDFDFEVRILSNGNFVSLNRTYKRRLSLLPYSRSKVYIDAGFNINQDWIFSEDSSDMPIDSLEHVLSIHNMSQDKYRKVTFHWDDKNKKDLPNYDDVKEILEKAGDFGAQGKFSVAEVEVAIK